MQKDTQLRALSERILQFTLATLERRPLPISAHQAAADLYNSLDRYTAALNHNKALEAKRAMEQLTVECMRVLLGYEMPAVPSGVENVHVETKNKSLKRPVKA